MCFSLGKFDYLIDPTALVRKVVTKGLGVDATTASVLSGDLLGHKKAVKDEERAEAKNNKKNNEAWQKYYATRDASKKSASALLSPTTEQGKL